MPLKTIKKVFLFLFSDRPLSELDIDGEMSPAQESIIIALTRGD